MSKELQKDGANPKKDKDKKELEVVIPESIKSILEKSSIPQKEKQLIAVQIASFFRGPLPLPDILEAYDSIVENGAERIFVRFEKQSDHRMALEKHAVGEELKQSSRGQLMGFIVTLFGLSLAGFMAWLGHETFATILGGGTIVSLAMVFVVGKAMQRKELKDK